MTRKRLYIVKTVDGDRYEITVPEDEIPCSYEGPWLVFKIGNTKKRFNILNIVSITTKIEEEN